MNLLKSVVGSIVIGVLGCGSPEAEQPERYAMSDVYHVLNDQGRRTGELTADSMVVSDDGNVAFAWNISVRLTQGPVNIRADSMTIDWARHEMRYHGEVDIPSLRDDIELSELVLYEW